MLKNNKKQILVVDDEVDIGFLMRRVLESEGYAVTYVQDLEAATEALEQTQFDTVFLDLNLDGEFGLDLVPRIRLSNEKTIIAIITAQKEPSVQERVQASGVDMLIEKPFSRKEILEALKY